MSPRDAGPREAHAENGDAAKPLDEIQAFVVDAVVRPSSFAEDEAFARACAGVTTGNARLSPAEQLDIYREQFWLRHTGALEEDFTSLAKLLGADAFYELCAKYIEAHPPVSFTLRDLGDRFVGFVESTAPYCEDELLIDLARVEWAFVTAFDAPDAPPLDPHKLAATPEEAWPTATIVIHPAVQRMVLRYPAQDLRVKARTSSDPDPDSDPDPAPDPNPQPSSPTLTRPPASPTFLVVFRGPESLQYIDLDEPAFVLLDELARGTPLGLACENTIAKLGLDAATFEGDVGRWFQSWTAWGWIVDLKTAD